QQGSERLIEIAAIEEAGEVVVLGEKAKALFAGAQRLLGPLRLGDVDEGGEDACAGAARSACVSAAELTRHAGDDGGAAEDIALDSAAGADDALALLRGDRA